MSSPRASAEASRLAVASKARVGLVEGPGPGIALVPHESLRHGQHVALPSRSMRHLAQQRRRVGEALGRQIAAHLGLGMLAGRDGAEDLQHHGIVDGQRAVRLLGSQPHDLGVGWAAQHLDLVRHGLEDDLALRHIDALAIGQRLQHAAGEDWQRKGIGQQTDTPPAADARQGKLRGQRGRRFVLRHIDKGSCQRVVPLSVLTSTLPTAGRAPPSGAR